MLTQGPAPDPKCDLNITPFFTLPHRLHCPISAKHIMVIVLLLQVMGYGKVGRWLIYLRVWVGGQGVGYYIFSIFCFLFVLLLMVLLWLVYDSGLCLFHCSFFGFFVSGPFN